MKLYLVQHGKAVDKSVDPERSLSEEGLREVDAITSFLASKQLAIANVWHSGKKRAEQTAERLADDVGASNALGQRDGLAPNDDVCPWVESLADITDDTMLVGHLPFMDRLASLLLAGDEGKSIVAFRNAGVLCLGRDDKGHWKVEWYVVPEVI